MKKWLKALLAVVITAVVLFIAVNIYISRSRQFPVEAKVFEAPETSSSSWEQVLNKPGPVEVEVFDTGGVKARKSKLLNFDNPKAEGLIDEDMDVRVYSYLIHHEKYGYYLVDAGLNASVQKDKYGDLKGLMVKRIAQGYTQQKGQDMVSQLKERKITPKGIFFTHLHYDHTSGLPGLPEDIQCYMGVGEIYWNYKFIYESDYLKGYKNLNWLDFSSAEIIKPFGPVLDIFGDGSVWAVSTPGHTYGHVSYLINAKEGPIFIAGDAGPTKYGVETGIGPGTFSSDVKRAQESFDKIMEFHKTYPQVKIYNGHELP